MCESDGLLVFRLLPFLSDWTNLFDLCIVAVSIVGLSFTNLPNVKVPLCTKTPGNLALAILS